MVIYHLFLNGKYQFKTNSIESILDTIKDFTDPTCINLDYVFDGLILKHEYHFFDFDKNRKIDIVASIYGQ